jgi:hypothetical protein
MLSFAARRTLATAATAPAVPSSAALALLVPQLFEAALQNKKSPNTLLEAVAKEQHTAGGLPVDLASQLAWSTAHLRMPGYVSKCCVDSCVRCVCDIM